MRLLNYLKVNFQTLIRKTIQRRRKQVWRPIFQTQLKNTLAKTTPANEQKEPANRKGNMRKIKKGYDDQSTGRKGKAISPVKNDDTEQAMSM